ncbi:hypothetical protein FQR65_LT01766 [Abscondita terminalis]|nr:hypothetical protein FQR65_LT01766 [Abscondita terminalis]
MYQNSYTSNSNLYDNIEQNLKRNDANQRISIYNTNFLHLKDLTQEILESEYEPINKVPLSVEEQEIEEFDVLQLNSDNKENTQINRNISSDSVDACFNTPLKSADIFKIPPPIFSSTPRVLEPHKDHFITNVKKVPDIKKIVINNVTYQVLKQLGRGGSAVVYDCLDIKNNTERAVKVINLDTDLSTVVGYQNEVQLLRVLNNCEHIIKMLDYKHLQSEKKLLVVLEKGGSDLAKLVRDLKVKNKNLPIHKVLFYWMEMLYAVQEIHKNGIIHADLKPANFLQVDCGLKLIDFGIASRIKDDETSIVRNHVVGSFNYISPEALTNNSGGMDTTSLGEVNYKINCKSDVWSLGCIFYELLYGNPPFGHIKNTSAKLSTIMDPDHKINYPTFQSIPRKFIDTIKNCLQYDVKNRISIDDLIREYENIYN